ncbi:androgen-induced gene 1 protein-like [Huso huso]|uniref:Androgen-induced gene 1 protein-like n=1 Tax=Huso huso TaxID=61971 RepID=A0ABR0Z3S2_HUSHU
MAATVLACRTPGLIHFVIFSWYVFTVWHNVSITASGRHPGTQSYGGRWKYLTFLDLFLQTAFFGLCFLTDVTRHFFPKLGRGAPASFLTDLRDTILAVLALPVGSFVVLSFWLLYAYDRELVYPRFLDDIIPQWLNHAMHTVILPLLLVELYIIPHRFPSRKKGILGLTLFSGLYVAWVFWIHHVSGVWVYPILGFLSPLGRGIFLAAASLTMVPLYFLGEKLNTLLWGQLKKKKNK